MIDNGEPDYVDFIRDRSNGFLSVRLPIKGGTELPVKIHRPSIVRQILPVNSFCGALSRPRRCLHCTNANRLAAETASHCPR